MAITNVLDAMATIDVSEWETILSAKLADVETLAKTGKARTEFIGVTMDTEVSQVKATRFPGARKITCGAVLIGSPGLYQASVNNSLLKQGETADFVPGPLPWGERIGDTCIIRHKPKGSDRTKLYVSMRFVNKPTVLYYSEQHGAISHDDIKEYLKPTTSKEGVIWRTPAIESILSVRHRGLSLYASDYHKVGLTADVLSRDATATLETFVQAG